MKNINEYVDTKNIKSLQDFCIHYSWDNFFKKENVPNALEYVFEQLKVYETDETYKMSPKTVAAALNIFTKDLSNAKVIVVGMDPYPTLDVVENSRAFEVSGLESWDTPFRQHSLKNIIRVIYSSYYCDMSNNQKIPKFKEIVQLDRENVISLIPPNEIFDYWEKQGAFFINRFFTCDIDTRAGSHRNIWRGFSNLFFSYLLETNRDTIWFLWGNDAEKIKNLTNQKRTIYISNHPRLYSTKNDNAFLKTSCFKDTKDIINWL